MNNFGVIEVASARTTNAPGWAYVPDTGSKLSSSHPQAANRKRARNTGANLSYADLNARQEAKIRKELEALDRDNVRDVVIPIPPKPAGSSRTAGGGQGKHTANVRKILQSQKTFANHLDDFIALGEGGGGTSAAAANTAGAAGVGSSRSAAAAASAAISRAKGGAAQQQKKPDASSKATGKQNAVKQEDVDMVDAPASEPSNTLLPPYNGLLPVVHPSDNNPLLVSRVPPMPSDEELRALMAVPPLTYLEAKAGWNEEDEKYPTRVFCVVCGYWGRVKCMKCGVRVCALECLETHREECLTRYGL